MHVISIAVPFIYTLATSKHTFADSKKKPVPIPISDEASPHSPSALVSPVPQATTGEYNCMFACMCVNVHGSVGTSFIMSSYCPVLDEEPNPEPPHPVRTKVCTWNPDEVVDLAMGVSGIESVETITVGQLFKNTVGRHGKDPALKYKQNGRWEAISYSEYHSYCIKAAKSFLKVRV